MNQHLQSTNDVVASVRERLGSSIEPTKMLEAVVKAVMQRYSSVEIFLALEDRGVCKSSNVNAHAGATMAEVDAEIAVPIMLGAKTLGLLVAETQKGSAPRQERALLEQVANLIAEHVRASLAANRGKQAPRKASDKLVAAPVPAAKRKGPQAARAALRKAAAGDHFSR